MTDKPWFFILGAGASVDSGLCTYRGPGRLLDKQEGPGRLLDKQEGPGRLLDKQEGPGRLLDKQEGPGRLLDTSENITSKKRFNILHEMIMKNKSGKTYELIKEIAPNGSYILNQNIDGYIQTTEHIEVINVHIRGMGIPLTYDDVVQIGQPLPKKKIDRLNFLTSRRRPSHVIVIGTSMRFPYLRHFIQKVKQKAAKVIHINPDEDYNIVHTPEYNPMAMENDKPYSNVKPNEIWLECTAAEGLRKIMEKGPDDLSDEYSDSDDAVDVLT